MKIWRNGVIVVVLTAMLLVTACGQQLASEEKRPETVQRFAENEAPPLRQPFMMQQQDNTVRSIPTGDDQSVIRMVMHGTSYYVPLLEVADALGYNYAWDEAAQMYQFGYTDPILEVKLNTNQVTKEEQAVQIDEASVMLNNSPYIPLSGFELLFNEELVYTVQDNQLVLQTNDADIPTDLEADEPTSPELDFADDPEDPAEDEEVWGPLAFELEEDVPALKNINVNGMISTARRYLGVKYKFGAKPYTSSYRWFDCSSYVQFVFNKYGVKLPRTARAQAKLGNRVSRKNLRKGDLMYFYVPGRFKTNKTVGHVGIYIGNNRMIHSSPKPKNGVQITNINKAYWKRTFLGAKRLVY